MFALLTVDIILGKPLQVFVKSGDEARVAAVRVDNDKINMAMVCRYWQKVILQHTVHVF